MEFEYNSKKSASNRQKHGISLEEAKALWFVSGLEIEARTQDEPRFLRIGKLEGKFYSCIYTVRGNVVRLISARRSRREEEKIYEEAAKNEKPRKEN